MAAFISLVSVSDSSTKAVTLVFMDINSASTSMSDVSKGYLRRDYPDQSSSMGFQERWQRAEVNLREVYKGALPPKYTENMLCDHFTSRQI